MSFLRKFYYLQKANLNQWKNIQELKEIQRKKLRKIIDYAYHNVSFYHDTFRKNKIHPTDINDLEDLNKLPLLSKDDIRDNFPDKIISRKIDYSKCKLIDTSGSTGLPLKVAYDAKADDFAKAILLRSYIGNGLRYFDRWCVIGPPEYETEKNKTFFMSQKFGFLSPFYISIFESVTKKIELLKKYNPRVLDSLAVDLFLVARYVKENDIKGVNPEIVTTNAEILDIKMRKYINDVFGVELSDVYGCMELRRTAWECPCHEGYHIDIDSIVMQFIKDGDEVSPGEEGKIVLTGLYNYAMPLIRYDIEDIGVPSDEMCSCGRGFPMMKILGGKLLDYIVTRDGELLSPHVLKGFLMFISGIKMFKIIQESKEKVKILIVKDKDYKNESNKKIEKKFKDLLGEDTTIDIEFVEEIKREGRKHKVIESKLSESRIF